MSPHLGLAGRLASAFIDSRLTPLVVIAALLAGVFALIITPREEEPQILVPMIDVFVAYPGASPREVEERVTRPMERLLWEVPAVEYVYSISRPGLATCIVRFRVGESFETSLVNLHTKLQSNADLIPPGVGQPLVKPRSIDDVSILAVSLWSDRFDGLALRQVAAMVAEELKEDPEVSEIQIIGGQRRQVLVELDPVALRGHSLTIPGITASLAQANVRLAAGSFPVAGRQLLVEAGRFLTSAAEVAELVVAVHNGRPVKLGDVARVTDGPEEPESAVFMGFGPAAPDARPGQFDAVTLSLAKKKGANATAVASRSLAKIEALKGGLIPTGIEATVSRNYGETAKEKSDELLKHMAIAAVSVTVLVGLFLGARAAVVVGVAVPVTLALTILVTYLYGYTLNRVTLFALIFSIGILVDDAIVVVENLHRHFQLHGASRQTAVAAVAEVGNPTILATGTVIAALLPMAFVSGLMGPYMRPIPVGASAAMLLSLAIAFVISPWLGFLLLRGARHQPAGAGEDGWLLRQLNRAYEKNLRFLLKAPGRRLTAYGLVALLLAAAVAMVAPWQLVTVKMLPFDNKAEVAIVVDLPEGAALEETAALTRRIADLLAFVPEVTHFQTYLGLAAPYTFNGLVRHSFLRTLPHQAEIQVNLLPRHARRAQSHEIAGRLRPAVQALGQPFQAKISVVEVPPGPPVLSTLVAEVYGPEHQGQIAIASRIKEIFAATPGVVDVDWYVDDDQPKERYVVNQEKAARHGISTQAVAETLAAAVGGGLAGLVHLPEEREPVPLRLRLPLAIRAQPAGLAALGLAGGDGAFVSLAELVDRSSGVEDQAIYRKNLKRVVYVVAEVAGAAESPVYPILAMKKQIAQLPLPAGYELAQHSLTPPWLTSRYAMKWDGEWHITLEVFRDLGIAFAAVLVLISIMVVGWFRSFSVPLVIMAPIPLSLVGILPGHAAIGAFFTATSMIGFIAGAGIVVRNSIILVDFIELQLAEGLPLTEAVVSAGLIRFRPMLLTAAAVVVGSSVILFDPIFQGMAVALMAGEVASTLLSRTLVPVLYYGLKRRQMTAAAGTGR
ncbi:MAG: efflux RND transporter permease subunit [Thermodesulfobacteriota bacterium]